MAEKSTSTATASVSFGWGGLLLIILIVLKLNPGGYLDSPVEDWSWWLVLLPAWIGIAIFLGFLLVGAVGIAVYTFLIEPVVEKRKAKKRKELLEKRRVTNYNRFR